MKNIVEQKRRRLEESKGGSDIPQGLKPYPSVLNVGAKACLPVGAAPTPEKHL